MPTAAVPQTVRDALGEQAAGDLAAWFDTSIQEHAVPRDEYREVITRLDVIDERFERVDQRFEQMEAKFEQRFARVEEELAAQRRETGELRGEMSRMRSEMNERFDAMGAKFDQRLDQMNEAMRRQTRWTVGAIIVIGAILSALLSIAEFAA